MQASPDRLATRYGLLIGGANVALVMAAWLGASNGGAALSIVYSLLSWIVFLGSLILVVQLGYVAAKHYGTVGAVFGPGA